MPVCELYSYDFTYPEYRSIVCITDQRVETDLIAEIRVAYYEAICEKDEIDDYINDIIDRYSKLPGWIFESANPTVTPIMNGAFYRVGVRIRLRKPFWY